PDVDAELERCGRNERLELAAFETLLRLQPPLFGEAAVMGHDVLGAEPLAQLARGALGESTGIYENQRRAVLSRELRQSVIQLGPDLARHDRLEGRGRQLDRKIAPPAVARIDDGAATLAPTG